MRSAVLSVVLLGGALVGCGGPGPFDYVPVSGQVTYEDGSPIPAGFRLVFVAQDAPPIEGAHPRPAEAIVDAQGKFDAATSYKYGDGLIPGRHKVVIQPDRSQAGRNLVPKDFTTSETTPLVIDTAETPFAIRVPKP